MDDALDENIKVSWEGHREWKSTTEHGLVCLGPLMFTWGIFVGVEEHSYDHRYCYPNLLAAQSALRDWEAAGFAGEPEGYIVRKG